MIFTNNMRVPYLHIQNTREREREREIERERERESEKEHEREREIYIPKKYPSGHSTEHFPSSGSKK